MNLWVNRLRQLALLSVALFFFACEDETSLNGFKNPNPKFEGKYVEIPLSTSNLLLDKIRTSNYLFEGEYNRFLIGSYDDPIFGKVTSTAFTQFLTSSSTKIPAGATIEKMTFELALDLSVYGAQSEQNQVFNIYELSEPLQETSKRSTYYHTETTWEPEALIATKTVNINPGLFKDYIDWKTDGNAATPDTTVYISIEVDKLGIGESFYARLAKSFQDYSATPSDTTFVTFSKFRTAFPGLVIECKSESGSNNIILGVNSAQSRIIIHYGTATAKYANSLIFSYPYALGYNMIKAERTGELAALVPHQQQSTEDGSRYIQAGTGLVTKLHLDKFYEFANENDGKDLLINSAQLLINDVAISEFAPPSALALRLLDENNNLRKFKGADAERDSALFAHRIVPDFAIYQRGQLARATFIENDSTYYGVADNASGAVVTYSGAQNRYSGFVTLLFQRLYKQRQEANRMSAFALYPTDPTFTNIGAKSVNRVVFPSDKVVLKIFYTEPTVKDQQ
jgi:hypothetical protein